MAWPTTRISTNGLESQSDTPPRRTFLTMARAVQGILSSRAAADGVASLNSSGRVPAAQLGQGRAGGVASLNSSGRVPVAQLGQGLAGGVASLDGSGEIPASQLPAATIRQPGAIRRVATVAEARDGDVSDAALTPATAALTHVVRWDMYPCRQDFDSGSITIGGNAAPASVTAWLHEVDTNGDQGYARGDVIPIEVRGGRGGRFDISYIAVQTTTTTIRIRGFFGPSTDVLYVGSSGDTEGRARLSPGRWRLRVFIACVPVQAVIQA